MKTDNLMTSLKASQAKIIFIFGPVSVGKTWTVNRWCELNKYKVFYITRYEEQANFLRRYMEHKYVISLAPRNYDTRFLKFNMQNGFADVLIFDEYLSNNPLVDERERMACLSGWLTTDDTRLILIEHTRCNNANNYYLNLAKQVGVYYEVYEL